MSSTSSSRECESGDCESDDGGKNGGKNGGKGLSMASRRDEESENVWKGQSSKTINIPKQEEPVPGVESLSVETVSSAPIGFEMRKGFNAGNADAMSDPIVHQRAGEVDLVPAASAKHRATAGSAVSQRPHRR